jgi:hypothetical protein
MRYLRLLITKGTSRTNNNYARIYEVQAFSQRRRNRASELVFVAPDVPPMGLQNFLCVRNKDRGGGGRRATG